MVFQSYTVTLSTMNHGSYANEMNINDEQPLGEVDILKMIEDIETLETLEERLFLQETESETETETEIDEEISRRQNCINERIKKFSEKITFLNNLDWKLRHYQLSNALSLLKEEYMAGFTLADPGVLTSKFGVLKTMKNFGKKRTILAACLASYSDSLDINFEIEKAVSRTMFCENTVLPSSSTSVFTRTTLLIVSPKKVLGWRAEMEELGIKYLCVEGKSSFDNIVKKNKGVEPVVLVCSVNIYRKFVDNPANSSKIWRRVVFAASEPPYNICNRPFSSNLRSSFFWTTFSTYTNQFRDTNYFIRNKAIQLNAVIGDAGQEEEQQKYGASVEFVVVPGVQVYIPKIYGKDSVVDYIKGKTVSATSRINRVKENIDKDLEDECTICNGNEFSKCIMICCLQMSCVSCMRKHMRSGNNDETNFSCMFCRAKSSTETGVVIVQTTNVEEPIQEHPVYFKINDTATKKVLVIAHTKDDITELTSRYSDSITFGMINTYLKISKIQAKILNEPACLIILTRSEFYKIHSHKIFSTITDVVNISEVSALTVFDKFVNPGRNPEHLLTIHDFVKEN